MSAPHHDQQGRHIDRADQLSSLVLLAIAVVGALAVVGIDALVIG